MRNDYRRLSLTMLLTVTLLALSCRAPEQSSSATAPQKRIAGPLEGVWREAEIVVTGRDASAIQNPQPSLYIFTPTHYAMSGVLVDHPRTLYKTIDPTKEEKIAAYDSFWSNAGTYEVTGDTVTIRPIIARVPNFMSGGFLKYEFRLDGDTLWLTGNSTDEYWRIGEQVVPDSRPPSVTRKKLVRLPGVGPM